MAKRKSGSKRKVERRGGSSTDIGIGVRVGGLVTKIGIPEVDSVMNDRPFRILEPKPPLFTRISAPNRKVVANIMEARQFPKLSPHRPLRRKFKRTKLAMEEDHISRMPDDILHCIISSLTLRQRVNTSILSTRWRYLWTASSSSLNFNIPNMFGRKFNTDMFENKGKQFLSDKRSDFAARVNRVLELRRSSRLDALRVCFGFNKEYACHIDRWIESAAAQGVTKIHLDFDLFKYHNAFSFDDRYKFPAQLVSSSLKYLHLDSCIFRLPPDLTAFTSLVTLSLVYTHVNQSVVDCILSKCPLLEFLSLENCLCDSPTRLKFVGPSLLLKHLHIGSAMGFMEIELHDVSLLSCELKRISGKLSLKNAPHLASLLLTAVAPVEVLSSLPRLRTLFLTECLKKSILPKSFELNNLKRLVFVACNGTTNLLTAVSLLEACHLLQELEIDMGITSSSRIKPLTGTMMRRLTTISGSPHNNLKEIEIYGFQALTKRIEFAKYLLKYAIVLEKMKIYTASKVYHGNGKWSLYEATAKQATSLKEVCMVLQSVARSSTKLELFTSLSQSVTMPT